MLKQYPHLAQLPHSDTSIAVPIAGLMTEVLDRHKAITYHQPEFQVTKIPIKPKHKEATNRIASCMGYLITIHYRLSNDKAPKLFLDKNLDWESLRIYTQILLDSFAVLVPLMYGLTPKYSGLCPTCQKTEKQSNVDSFNQLSQWFDSHELDDKFTKRYKKIKDKEGWYRLVNADRADFIHKRSTPTVVHKQLVGDHIIEKDLLIKISPKPLAPAAITTIEAESETLLRNLFDFLMFSSSFFVDTLKEQGCVVSQSDQFKYTLIFDNLKPFNTTLFGQA